MVTDLGGTPLPTDKTRKMVFDVPPYLTQTFSNQLYPTACKSFELVLLMISLILSEELLVVLYLHLCWRFECGASLTYCKIISFKNWQVQDKEPRHGWRRYWDGLLHLVRGDQWSSWHNLKLLGLISSYPCSWNYYPRSTTTTIVSQGAGCPDSKSAPRDERPGNMVSLNE